MDTIEDLNDANECLAFMFAQAVNLNSQELADRIAVLMYEVRKKRLEILDTLSN